MAGYNNNMVTGGIIPQQQPVQFPYNNNIYDNSYLQQSQMRMHNPNQFNQFLKCRPVSSREEAMAFQIDLDGSLWVFPNVGNGKIYTKQVNNDGTATFSTYNLTKNENPFNSNDYVTKDELNQVVKSIMAAIHPETQGTGSVQNNNNQINNAQPNMDF